MICLLYGSDTRASQKKLAEILEEYQKKDKSGLPVYRFDAEEDGLSTIKNTLKNGSLFFEKKLVVIKYLSLSSYREELLHLLKPMKDSTDVAIFLWERELAQETLVTVKLLCKKTQEFKRLSKPEPSASVFTLGDHFFFSTREGLRHLLQLLDQGHDETGIFSYLTNHARTFLTVKHYAGRKTPVPKTLGIHPFVVKKADLAVRTLTIPNLESSLGRFFREDHKIKTGVSTFRDSLFSLILKK